MTDIDFATCDFIDKNMNYINYFDFCSNCYSIKAMYNQLTNLGKRFYKWYVYSNIHMEESYKNAIWNFLNSDEVEYYMELIDKKQKYKII